MTPELANDYIRRRMKEMGRGDNYHIRFRHFVLSPMEVREVDGPLQFFLLAVPRDNIRIQSAMGVFDFAETAANELHYEHQGDMRLTNYSNVTQHLQMIQVIFKKK
jgi:hypothetical protein